MIFGRRKKPQTRRTLKCQGSPISEAAQRILEELVEAHPIGYRPKILWRNLRVSAGLAHFKDGVISLSKILLTTEERMTPTLKHEYAHLMAYARYGRKGLGHGPAWRAMMLELGEQPVVRHDYEVERNARRQQVTYQCARCGATFVRSRRLPKRHKYVHVGCGGVLQLSGVHRAA